MCCISSQEDPVVERDKNNYSLWMFGHDMAAFNLSSMILLGRKSAHAAAAAATTATGLTRQQTGNGRLPSESIEIDRYVDG